MSALFTLVLATQASSVASTGVRAAQALATAEKKAIAAEGAADNVLGVDASGPDSKPGSAFLELSGAAENSALIARVQELEVLATTEREAIQAQQKALAVLQEEQFNLAVREDAIEAHRAQHKDSVPLKASPKKPAAK